jgi:hypothetical protein
LISQLTKGASAQSYGALGFSLRWPPALLSAHLGSLSLLNPGLLLIALAEIGPIILLAPWVTTQAWKQARKGDWVFAGFGLGALVSFLLPLFTRYGMERDIVRLTAAALIIWLLLGFPLAWFAWQKAGQWLRVVFGGGYVAAILGGITILMTLLIAMPHPQRTYFIQDADAQMSQVLWDRLDLGAQVLDNVPYRSVTIFGRGAGRASLTTYTSLPEWSSLVETADPSKIAQAGYSYIYIDKNWWRNMTDIQREAFTQPCVQKVAEKKTYEDDFRWLLDVKSCQ